MPSSSSLDLVAGQDFVFNVFMKPPRDVSGWTTALFVSSAKVALNFPPVTLPPPGTYLWPTAPTFAVLNPAVAVIPGIQPRLPSEGTTVDVYRDSTDSEEGGGISTLDASNGVFQVSIPRALSLPLPPGVYFWQFWRIDAGFYGQHADGSLLVQFGR